MTIIGFFVAVNKNFKIELEISEEGIETKFCHSCGFELKTEDIFCRNCGANQEIVNSF